MADNVKMLTKIITFLVEGKYPVVENTYSDLPTESAKALKAWLGSENIPIDDGDTSGSFYKISFGGAGISDVFVADYSGDNPDPFRAIAILLDGEVIGESTDVAS